MHNTHNQNLATQPKVAVIIPCFNTKAYLGDAIESVLNQSYENLEIIIVDDGSTDSSLQIAKEYFNSDKRITIISKSNSGQGSARNAGIEYIFGGVELLPIIPESKPLDSDLLESSFVDSSANAPYLFRAILKPNALSHNNISYLTGEPIISLRGGAVSNPDSNNQQSPTESTKTTFTKSSQNQAQAQNSSRQNPQTQVIFNKPIDYSIDTFFVFSHSPTPPKDIKYIHFLDADDMLDPLCIQTCIETIGDCDIAWHDVRYHYEPPLDSSKCQPYPSLLETLHLNSEQITAQSFSALALWERQNASGFSFVAVGLFRTALLQNLRFCATIESEDALFGMILFAKAKQINILQECFLIYRLHTKSTSSHGASLGIFRTTYPPTMLPLVQAFKYDGYLIKHYNFAYSCAHICLGLLEFISTLEDKSLKNKLIAFLQVRAIYAFGGTTFGADPRNIRSLLKPLEPYMQLVSKRVKLAYFMPKTFLFLQAFKRIFKNSKG